MGTLDTAKPFYRIELYAPGALEPRSVISSNMFLESETPTNTEQASSEIYLISLNVTSKLDAFVNICELKFKHASGCAPIIDMGTRVKVYLGYYYKELTHDSEYSLVYTGYVTRSKVHMQETMLECRSDIYRLTTLRKKMAFNALMTIDDLILKFAIDEGGLPLAEGGIAKCGINKSPGYSISEQLTILDHLQLLSKYSGLFTYMDVADRFHAITWEPGSLQDLTEDDKQAWVNERGKAEVDLGKPMKHVFCFGEDLIACDFELSAGTTSGVEIIGFAPFCDDDVHTIDPPKVEFTPPQGADPELPKKVYKLSHVTREDAEKIAENIYYRINEKLAGNIDVLGAPQVRLGDGVQLAGSIYGVTPFRNLDFGCGEGFENKIFQVARVNHRFNDVEGFITRITLVDSQAGMTGA